MDNIIEKTTLYEIKSNSEKNYLTVFLKTDRGKIECQYYPVQDTDVAAIWVGGVGGDFDTPAYYLYPNLCEKLQTENIASLRVQFRHPHDLSEAAFDIASGIAFLEFKGIRTVGLIGHSFGGASVIQAATESNLVKTIVTLASQGSGTDSVSSIPYDCSILLIHGTEDSVLSYNNSKYIYELAHEPKQLILLKGNKHCLDESADEVSKIIEEWLLSRLKT